MISPTTETEVHQADIAAGELPPAQELLAQHHQQGHRPGQTAEPLCRAVSRCAGLRRDPLLRQGGRPRERDRCALTSRRLELQEGIAKYLARKIAELTVERRTIEFDKADFRLSETKPFSWRRNLPPLEAKRTVFNYVATYNDFERRFAEFLDKKAPDVLPLRIAWAPRSKASPAPSSALTT